MAEGPFRVERRQGVLYLTLDTPGSDVNIFDAPAAAQLRALMAQASWARAVVLRSAKPGSFLNGARLLALFSVRTPEDALRLSGEVSQAYAAVRQAPVPTVAAIRGNCYGCGLELALHCSHRIAADTPETRFYMTEIPEYLLLPAYGGLRHLPPLVGLEAAADLVLWGQRWNARQAAAAGLVDRVVEEACLDTACEALIEELLAAPPGPRPRPAGPGPGWLGSTRRRIGRLPPAYRPLYRQALEVLRQAARHGPEAEPVRELERQSFSQAAASPLVKPAVTSFMVRQMAEGLAAGPEGPLRLSLGELDGLAQELSGLRGVDFSPPRPGALNLELRPPGNPASGGSEGHHPQKAGPFQAESGSGVVEVRQGRARGPLRPGAPALLYLPFEGFFELAVAGAATPGHQALYRCLVRAGRRGALTRWVGQFVTERLLGALARPLRIWCRGPGSPASAAATLRRFGFPETVLERLPGPPAFRAGLLRARGGRASRRLEDAFCLALLAAAWRSVREGAVPHPSCLDVLAREALGFPLHLCTLCRFLTPAEASRRLERSDLRGLVTAGDLARVSRYISQGRGFYL